MSGSSLVAGAGIVLAAASIVVVIGVRHRPAVRSSRPIGPAGPPTPSRRVRVPRPIAAASLVGVGLIVLGWVPTLAIALAIAAARRARPLLAERRRRRDAERQLPEAIERLVLLVHAGLSPHLAVRAACRTVPVAVRAGFEEVVHRLDRGMPLTDALAALTDELGPRASAVADAFGAADRYGLPLEAMLDQLARDARAERRRLDEADARRLPVRLTFPLVTCTLPSFVLVAIAPAVLAALSSLGGFAG